MSKLTLQNVTKIYEKGQCVVDHVSLEIQDKEFLILVGPSGCGKSTTLRMIAGLEEISGGELWIDENLVNYVPSKERELSMVFQNYALYPNMTVYDNMAFSLQVRKWKKKEIEKEVHRAARILEIEHLLKQRPRELSGGQRQRVAIGSAIVRRPKAFLMDEPLSNLDAKLRAQMRVELSRLHQELQTTIVYVTHDQTEAMTLGTRIVVMKDGKIQQADTPRELYHNPINLFVAGFIGTPPMNFLNTTVGRLKEEWFLSAFGCKIGISKEKAELLKSEAYENKELVFGIRPEDIYTKEELEENETPREVCTIKTEIERIEMLGAETLLYFTLGGSKLCCKTNGACRITEGETVELFLDLDRMHLFSPATQQNLFYQKTGGNEACWKSA